MSSNATTVTTPATETKPAIAAPLNAPWMRGLFLILQTKGWTFTQIATNVDQYTKGDVTVTMLWGSNKLIEVHATKGKTVVLHSSGGQAAKLQRAQHQGFRIQAKESKEGKLADLAWTWNLSAKQRNEAKVLALTTLKVMEG